MALEYRPLYYKSFMVAVPRVRRRFLKYYIKGSFSSFSSSRDSRKENTGSLFFLETGSMPGNSGQGTAARSLSYQAVVESDETYDHRHRIHQGREEEEGPGDGRPGGEDDKG